MPRNDRTTPTEIAAFEGWLSDLGWMPGPFTGRSRLWRYPNTGNHYRMPHHSRTDLDRCRREIVMLSPEFTTTGPPAA